MAATPSTMLPLGTACPPFALVDAVSGRVVSDSSLSGRPLLVMFICNHCPYVIHVQAELGRLASAYGDRAHIVAINSNSVITHPQDGPEAMASLARKLGWPFPFLFDETQSVARAFHAACTPEFYVFDTDQKLAYRGQLDDSRPGSSSPVTGKDVRLALDAVLAGKPVPEAQRPSVGCSIKWHPKK